MRWLLINGFRVLQCSPPTCLATLYVTLGVVVELVGFCCFNDRQLNVSVKKKSTLMEGGECSLKKRLFTKKKCPSRDSNHDQFFFRSWLIPYSKNKELIIQKVVPLFCGVLLTGVLSTSYWWSSCVVVGWRQPQYTTAKAVLFTSNKRKVLVWLWDFIPLDVLTHNIWPAPNLSWRWLLINGLQVLQCSPPV